MDRPQILLIDPTAQHRKIVRKFITQSLPDATLIEIDPDTISINDDLRWADYDLLIIDNQLGAANGIRWVQQHQLQDCFPPVIFLSSMDNPESKQAIQSKNDGLQLGAESFLFKKHMDPKVFQQHLLSALEKYEQEKIQNCGRVTTLSNEDSSAQQTAKPWAKLQDTFHQMQHAKAMLHGHDDWPFPVKDLMAGQANFAGYQFVNYLGRRDGIYSFEGHAINSDDKLALKLVDKSITKGEPLPGALQKDLETLISFSHPNIVQWIDYQAVDGHLLMVQEFINGQRLSYRLDKNGVTETQAIEYILQILSALSCLHEAGLNAGEISPENLLFKDPETLVLTHLKNTYFDLSTYDSTMTMHIYKDSLYLSPEAVQGLTTDHRSDLYSVGAILYQMLAGNPPFGGKTTQDVLTGHVSLPTPSLPDSKHPMNPVIQELMMKTPNQRYQSAAEVSDKIRQLYNNNM